MSRDEDKLIRQLSLLSFLLSRPRPFTAREIQESVEGYWGMSDETFARRFNADRADLAKVGIDIRSSSHNDAGEVQVYYLPEEEYHLPAVDFTPSERRALALALAVLDGRFAYSRPLRMAFTAISQGLSDPLRDDLDHLPLALAPDEEAWQAGKQLARLEDACSRGKTVCFRYATPGNPEEERCLDPYSLFLTQGRWYVVGRDHKREAIRTFRVTRIKSPVRFLTEKGCDFTIPAEYDPEKYRARPPWLIGKVIGSATVRVDENLAWWVSKLQPHVEWLREDDRGCNYFRVPFADEQILLSWVVGIGDCGELMEPESLRQRLADALARVELAHKEESSPVGTTLGPRPPLRKDRSRTKPPRTEPIAPERLARAISLMQYLADERRPDFVTWDLLKTDLGLSRDEAEADLSLINLVNFGGGTSALFLEAGDEGVHVTRDVMADLFARPARLSPLMTRALLIAFDLLGEAVVMDNTDSLASVRDKIRQLAGADHSEGRVVVDEVMPTPPGLLETLNRSLREHTVVEMDYFTPTRGRLTTRRVEPYLLFRSRDGWYLEAYCLNAQAQRTFRLEFIRSAHSTGTTFTPRPDIDLGPRLFGSAFPSQATPAWAVVRFAAHHRAYLEDKGIGYECLPDGALRGRIPYLEEQWLVREIIRFLGDAVLEEPSSARKQVSHAAAALRALYTSTARQPEPAT